jgi:hypothetical protein
VALSVKMTLPVSSVLAAVCLAAESCPRALTPANQLDQREPVFLTEIRQADHALHPSSGHGPSDALV